jgi:hypothetical protein
MSPFSLRQSVTLGTACLLLGACGGDAVGLRNTSPGPGPGPAPFRLVVDSAHIVSRGDFSDALVASRVVLASDPAYAQWWDSVAPAGLRPVVAGFPDSVLIAVTQGARPTAGYGVWVDSVTGHAGRLVVHVHERTSVGCPVQAVASSPYEVVQLPALGDSVTFVVTQVTRTCT